MKKNKVQDDFLENLSRIPIVLVACEKSGISRNSIYRWRKQDPIFSKKMDQALADGVALVNDMSESQLLTMIKEKNWSAIRFWLSHRNDNYKNKIEVTTNDNNEALTPSQTKVVKQALKLASITKTKAIKKVNQTNL
jgi:hypothetical protein